MHRLSLSVYEDELSMQQIGKLFDNTSELYLATKKLTQALPGFDLSETEKMIFENMARQLQIEANNLGYMTQNKDKEGMRIIYKRLNDTCIACHELFRF
jgi:cytochrome c556